MSPFNAKTKREYQGKNAAFLHMEGFKSPEWATFLQWKELGFKVNKGSKSCEILKVVDVDGKDGQPDKAIRTYSVFNREQVSEA